MEICDHALNTWDAGGNALIALIDICSLDRRQIMRVACRTWMYVRAPPCMDRGKQSSDKDEHLLKLR